MHKFSKLENVTLRPQQKKAIELFKKTNMKYLAIEMPTGQGKSIFGMTIAEMVLDKKEEK